MEMSASELEAYTSQLSKAQEAAAKYADSSIQQFVAQNPDASKDEMADFAAETLLQAVRVYGDQAAVTACAQYDATMDALGIDADAAEIVNEYSEEQARSRAFSAMATSAATSSFMSMMAQAAADKTLEAANRTTSSNADRDFSKGVRWARVPTGRETCGFCVMLGSRGFVYKSEDTAGKYDRYHDRCDCRVVAGTADTSIEGYDPEWLYEVYQDARKTSVGPGTKSDAEDAICNEINLRSKGWIYSKTDGSVKEGGKSVPSSAISALTSHGFDVETATEDAALDLKMNGRWWSVTDVEGIESARSLFSSGNMRAVVLSDEGGDLFEEDCSSVAAMLREGEQALVVSSTGERLRRLNG